MICQYGAFADYQCRNQASLKGDVKLCRQHKDCINKCIFCPTMVVVYGHGALKYACVDHTCILCKRASVMTADSVFCVTCLDRRCSCYEVGQEWTFCNGKYHRAMPNDFAKEFSCSKCPNDTDKCLGLFVRSEGCWGLKPKDLQCCPNCKGEPDNRCDVEGCSNACDYANSIYGKVQCSGHCRRQKCIIDECDNSVVRYHGHPFRPTCYRCYCQGSACMHCCKLYPKESRDVVLMRLVNKCLNCASHLKVSLFFTLPKISPLRARLYDYSKDMHMYRVTASLLSNCSKEQQCFFFNQLAPSASELFIRVSLLPKDIILIICSKLADAAIGKPIWQ